jgi:SAM-dependent methyltransferase
MTASPAVADTSRRRLWTDETVAWYRRADAWSDYAPVVLGAAAPLVARSRTALDVGAGFGALALPLARRMARVTAVEPAPAMVRALLDAAARRGTRNVAVLAATWQQAWAARSLAPHDVVVCAHVSGLLGDRAFLGAASALARRGVLLVRDAPGGQPKFFFDELYPRLLGRPYARDCDRVEETLDVLGRLGIRPEVGLVTYRSDQPFDSLEQACDFWMAYLGLDDKRSRRFLRGFLAERLDRRGDLWVAPYAKRAAVIQWPVDGAPEEAVP